MIAGIKEVKKTKKIDLFSLYPRGFSSFELGFGKMAGLGMGFAREFNGKATAKINRESAEKGAKKNERANIRKRKNAEEKREKVRVAHVLSKKS